MLFQQSYVQHFMEKILFPPAKSLFFFFSISHKFLFSLCGFKSLPKKSFGYKIERNKMHKTDKKSFIIYLKLKLRNGIFVTLQSSLKKSRNYYDFPVWLQLKSLKLKTSILLKETDVEKLSDFFLYDERYNKNKMKVESAWYFRVR